MFRRLMPKRDVFFRYMEESADKAVEIVAAFGGFLQHPAEAEERFAEIRRIEHEADAILHKALEDLHKAFVTPLDRHEISKISKRLDDVIDLVEGAAQRMFYYELREAPEPLRQLTGILERQIHHVRDAVRGLADLRNAARLHELIVMINTLENEADLILRTTVARLFREEEDARVIIKWKEVYENIELATDRCEDVSDNIENILLEYA